VPPTPTGADNSTVVTGLFYGGGTHQLVAQIIGSVAIGGATLAAGLFIMYLLKWTRELRITVEHGTPAHHRRARYSGVSQRTRL
jgi:ammonium transporter, Amt family